MARRWAETPRQIAVIVVGFIFLLALPMLADRLAMPDLITLGSQVAIFAIAAVSLDLLIGYCGLSSFGHAAFFGLGGYVVGILAFHAAEDDAFLGLVPGTTQAWIVWPAAILVASLAALAIGALSLRTTGVQFIMITLAFAEMLYFLFISLKAYGGDDGLGFRRRSSIAGIDPRDDVAFYYVCLAALVLFLLLCRRIVRSRFGLVLQGIRQNERRMAAIGVATYRYKLVAFVIAGAGAGLAGALDANLLRFVSPDLLHWTNSGDMMVMVVVGGAGSLFGAVFGAALMIAAAILPVAMDGALDDRDGAVPGVVHPGGPERALGLSRRHREMSAMLEVRGLVKRFGGLVATNQLDLDVVEGEIHALIGPNGAGKSTLIDQISGEQRPDAGEIRFGGEDILKLSVPQAGTARVDPIVPGHVDPPGLYRARERGAGGAGSPGAQLPLLGRCQERRDLDAACA